MNKFKITTKTVSTSELNLTEGLRGEDRIIDICKVLDADQYYSGRGAMAYQNEENFNALKIKLTYDDFFPIDYNQLWGSFISNVSILDYVFNYAYDWENYINMQKQKRYV